MTKPDAATLRAAIQRTLDEPRFCQQAQRLADEIASMPTIDSAVDVLLGLV